MSDTPKSVGRHVGVADFACKLLGLAALTTAAFIVGGVAAGVAAIGVALLAVAYLP